ncbi:MAG: PHP domain-containing protein [bacterium]|nr:PHP domain-containing protein [bacterium]
MIDLHLHSSHSSDGEIEPEQLAEMAGDIGLQAIALTDHDTVSGMDEFLAAGERIGIETIPGVEITTTYEGRFTHILGYFIDYRRDCITEYIARLEDARREQTAGRIAKLRELGIAVSEERVDYHARGRLPVGPIIGMAVLEDEANREHPLLRLLFEGPLSEKPFFHFDRELLADGKPASYPVERPSIFDAINVILEAGGLPVFAHPGDKYRLPEDEAVFVECAGRGMVGIEVYCSYHGADEERSFGELADRLGLVRAAGSDFHGLKVKPDVKMGDISFNDYSIVEELKSRL